MLRRISWIGQRCANQSGVGRFAFHYGSYVAGKKP
jgi:hypothetical protein